MSKFYFFTDIDLLSTQSQADAFGHISQDVSNNYYRLSSKHTASSNPFAYAICGGQVVVQEISSTHANIILKPREGIKGLPKVAYYIYRNIKVDKLYDANGDLIEPALNTLCFNILHAKQDTKDKTRLSANITSATTNFADTDPVSNLFDPNINTIGKVWDVDPGWSLGEFDSSGFGFDVLLDAIGFEPTLALARSADNVYQLPILASPTAAQTHTDFSKREYVLNYVDPCALYSSFYDDKLWARSSTDSVNSKLIPSFIKYKEINIYNNIIDGDNSGTPKTHFYNKNTLFIDIRNELNHSLNYFKCYDDEILLTYNGDEPEVALAGSSGNETDYYVSEWPILKLALANETEEIKFLRLRLPVGTRDAITNEINIENNRGISYVSSGTVLKDNGQKKANDRFLDHTASLGEIHALQVINIKLNSFEDSSNKFHVISSYINVRWFKRNYKESQKTTSPTKNVMRFGFMDKVFQPLHMYLPQSTITGELVIKVYEKEVYIDSKSEFGTEYLADVGVLRDDDHIAFFVRPDTIRETKNGIISNLSRTNSSKRRAGVNHFSKIKTGRIANKTLFEFLNEISQNYKLTKETLANTDGSPPVTDQFDIAFFTEDLNFWLWLGSSVAVYKVDPDLKFNSIFIVFTKDNVLGNTSTSPAIDSLKTKATAGSLNTDDFRLYLGLEVPADDEEDDALILYSNIKPQLTGYKEDSGDINVEQVDSALEVNGYPIIELRNKK